MERKFVLLFKGAPSTPTKAKELISVFILFSCSNPFQQLRVRTPGGHNCQVQSFMQQWRSAYISVSILVFADSHTIHVSSLVGIVTELIRKKMFPSPQICTWSPEISYHCAAISGRRQWLEVSGAPEPLSPGAPEPALTRAYRRPRNKSTRSGGVQTRKEIESFSREQAIWRGYVVNY